MEMSRLFRSTKVEVYVVENEQPKLVEVVIPFKPKTDKQALKWLNENGYEVLKVISMNTVSEKRYMTLEFFYENSYVKNEKGVK